MADNDRPLESSSGFPTENRDGTPALVGPDEYTRQLLRQRADRDYTTQVVAGNFADLQRMGADKVQGSSSSNAVGDAIASPPGLDIKDSSVISPAQQEAARGEWTRETERTGLLDAPAAHVPAENADPNPVDPGSVSPTVESKGKASSTPSTPATKGPNR